MEHLNKEERKRAANKKYREANREKRNAQNKKWREANKGKNRERLKLWREANKEKIKIYGAEYRKSHDQSIYYTEKRKLQIRKYCQDNKEIIKEKWRKFYRDPVSDSYIKNRTGLTDPQLIEQRRLEIKLKRKVYEIQRQVKSL